MMKSKMERMRDFFQEIREMSDKEFTELFNKVNNEEEKGYQYYTHIAYAESEDGIKGFSHIYKDTSKYVGIVANAESPEPPLPSEYNWVEITPNSLLTKSNKNDIIQLKIVA